MSVSCECCVFGSRGLCNGPINVQGSRIECECVTVCDHMQKLSFEHRWSCRKRKDEDTKIILKEKPKIELAHAKRKAMYV